MDLATAIGKTLDEATPPTRSIFGGTRAMSANEVTEFISEYPVALVSTVGAGGAPHVTGKAVALVNGKIYLGAREGTAMRRNLDRNPGVALAFAEPPWKRHLFVHGTVRFLEAGGGEERQAQEAHRAAHGYETSGVLEVLPRKVFTWKGSVDP